MTLKERRKLIKAAMKNMTKKMCDVYETCPVPGCDCPTQEVELSIENSDLRIKLRGTIEFWA